MAKNTKDLNVESSIKQALANEHAGIMEKIDEYEKYARAHPDDKWASGQVRYWRKRLRQLSERLGDAKNR